LSGSGAAAFAEFWAWTASTTLGCVMAGVLLVVGLGVVVGVRPTVLLDDPELRRPFAASALVVFGYVGIAYSPWRPPVD
jgi:hypothetical protein